MFRFNRSSRRGFTLVEMLAVIAIIGILSVLLFPVLQGLQGQARTAQCISNLRNLGNGVFGYVAEYDGRLPSMRAFDSGGAWKGPFWADLIEPFVGAESSKASSEKGQKTVFYCPAEKSSHTISDYGANPLVILPPNATESQALSMSRIEVPSGTLLLADAQILKSGAPIGSWHIATNWYTPDIPEVAPSVVSGVSPRHGKNVNLLFADGHVESTSYEAFQARGRRVFTPEKD